MDTKKKVALGVIVLILLGGLFYMFREYFFTYSPLGKNMRSILDKDSYYENVYKKLCEWYVATGAKGHPYGEWAATTVAIARKNYEYEKVNDYDFFMILVDLKLDHLIEPQLLTNFAIDNYKGL